MSLRIEIDSFARGSARHDIFSYVIATLPAVLLLLAAWPSVAELIRYWIEIPDYHYGFLIAAISVIWTIVRLPLAIGRGTGPDVRFIAPLVVTLFLWYVLSQGNSATSSQLLLPFAIWLCFAVTIGPRAAKLLAGPIGYFYFAIPVWAFLLPYLQQGTIFGAKTSMQLAGIPVTVTGIDVRIAEGTFQVMYECAGLRYFIVSLALATLYAMVERMSIVRASILIAIAGIGAVLANWIRVFIVMIAGHVTGMSHYFITESHEGVGNVVFVFLLGVIFFAARRLQGSTVESEPPMPSESVGLALRPALGASAAACIAVALIGVVTARAASITANGLAKPQLLPLPTPHVDSWQGPLPASTNWSPEFAKAQQTVKVAYLRRANPGSGSALGTSQVYVYANVFGLQKQSKEMVYYRNTVLAPGKWQRLESKESIASAGGPVLAVGEYQTDQNERWLVGETYVVGGRSTTLGLGAQLLYGFSTLTNPAPAGVIAAAIRCDADCDHSYAMLRDFWPAMAGVLVDAIPAHMITVSRSQPAHDQQ
ncbi:MAG TPA: exosortase [Steroidobacteraceae bacterium]|nr:exosortase [Steroidobacteraceae bacterium]